VLRSAGSDCIWEEIGRLNGFEGWIKLMALMMEKEIESARKG
jgi:hypothetical protein